MIAASIKAYEHEQHLWIYEDAGAQFSETLLFMALHDEFGFGQKRMERIVKYWNELPEKGMNLREWIQCIAKYGYDNKEMDRRYAVKVLPLASSGLMRRNKINGREYKDRIHNVILGAVVITYHIIQFIAVCSACLRPIIVLQTGNYQHSTMVIPFYYAFLDQLVYPWLCQSQGSGQFCLCSCQLFQVLRDFHIRTPFLYFL